MYEIIVLKEGYCSTEGTGGSHMKACGTCTLVKGPKKIIVDTGNPWDRELLLERLSKNEVSVEEVDHVVCTHGHSDHVGNLNIFPNAVIIVSYDICHRDQYLLHAFDQGIPYEIDDNVEVIPTPGHTGADVSVVVRNTKYGTMVIAGDLFECAEDLDNPHIWQQSSEKPEVQQQSRIDVLHLADYIIPGHGPMFKVPEQYKTQLSAVMVYEEYTHIAKQDRNTITQSLTYEVFEAD